MNFPPGRRRGKLCCTFGPLSRQLGKCFQRKGGSVNASVTSKLCGFLVGLTSVTGVAGQLTAQESLSSPVPSLNFYGMPGLIDTPSGLALPDGELVATISHFAGMTRYQFSAQIHPRIAGGFRYSQIDNFNSAGFETYYDRSFDLRFTLVKEGGGLPEITLGLQDFIGTGIYGAEYVVATKTLSPQLIVSGGLGWGRLGSSGQFSGWGERPRLTPDRVAQGGEPNLDSLFRGDVGVFGGIEWRPQDNLAVKVEYSSDEYDLESGDLGIFDRSSPFNFGVEYEPSPGVQLGAYYLYGSEFGLRLTFAFNPAEPSVGGSLEAGPPPILPRPSRTVSPDAYGTGWSESESTKTEFREQLATELVNLRLEMEALELSPQQATLYLRNTGYMAQAQAMGRAARLMARYLPSSIEVFTIVPVKAGLALPSFTFSRTDLENLEIAPDGAEAILAAARISENAIQPSAGAYPEDVYPRFIWRLGPYARTSLFDPDNPFRIDLGVELGAGWEISRGLILSGALRKKVVGNLDESTRESNSTLPHVRSDFALYDQNADPGIENLTAEYFFQPAQNFYGRMSVGYLEQMYAGVSSEILWAPYDSRIALGAELNYVQQRDFDGGFGLLDYEVVTGHASLYYKFNDDFYGQVDAGQYLAGDIGATFTLERVFANGWRVGAFATFTDVSADEFGEGSFDKGIKLSVPLGWFTGQDIPSVEPFTIRPLQRDGGARLNVSNRLYGLVGDSQKYRVEEQWGRFWR